ncbi:hypothetical protein [Actinomadura rubrisoli]|uniref:Uncharacterized protein n=1 Tax=Actinomadura rubrisoli TaxID=2530368 RepID=A0A4R5CF91_9ACTN|nr:hypothetical protein [Actinomadura rubrisoli]TDD97679.1 hypothetical protein E1298_01190 [Actinomadura rubrisoli]
MGFDLLLALWIAYYLTRNTVQDLSWKARGEDPPSFRREQERWKRSKGSSGGGPGRRFFANAWSDACASADERRARMAKRAAARRRSKWAKKDLADAEDHAYEINERMDPSVDDQAPAPSAKASARPSAGPSADPTAEAPQAPDARCYLCNHEFRLANLRPLHLSHAPEGTVLACRSCWETETARQKADTAARQAAAPPVVPEQEDKEVTASGKASGGTVTDLSRWRSKGSTPPITKEDIVSGETTNLIAALRWTQEMATQSGAAVASTEISISTMRNAGVSGAVIDKLALAQDLASHLTAAFDDAHAELEADMVVKDAYQARQGAGDKEFVTQD